MNRLCFLSTIFAFTSAFAATSTTPAADKADMSNLKSPLSLYETFDNDGVNLGIRADALYMVYNAPSLTFASEQTTSSHIIHSKILDVPGKMSWGCDIALLYTMPNQPSYSFEAGWYHIRAKFSHHVHADNIVPAHSVALTHAAPGSASVDAHTTINFFDLLIKKDFSFGDWFFVTPTAGLIGGYINGGSTAKFSATSGSFAETGPTVTEASLSYTTKFEGIGLRLGGSSAFRIWKGFKLKAEFFYNVLYGLSKVSLDYSQNGFFSAADLLGSDAHYQQHTIRAFFDSLLGLAWETHFCDDSLYLDLHAGWRFQTFSHGWNEFEAEFNNSVRELGLNGQGLQAGATFRF